MMNNSDFLFRNSLMKVFSIPFFVIILFLFTACTPRLQKFSETRFKMGTVVQITLFEKESKEAQKQIDKAFAEIDRIADLFWEGNPESEIYRFNHRQSDTVTVSAEVVSLISRAKQISKNTTGAFDMTVGTLKNLYNFTKGEEKIPTLQEIEETLKYTGFQHLKTDLRENLLISDNQEFMIITGAIVKGYAAQRALQIILKENSYGVLVNAGGDIAASRRYDGKKWVVGVQNPLQRNGLLGTISVSEGAVVTSGDYEQFSIINGQRYHHIINPKTGHSADKSHAATVIADNAELADALATGLFVLGADEGMAVLEKYPQVECLWVDTEGKIIQSEGFDDYFSPLK